MEEFFDTTLTKLNTNNYNELTLVIGNESCDLDSAVSAIVFANFLTWQYNQIRCKVCTKAKSDKDVVLKDDIFVPILNVDRNDYELKTEVVYYLRSKGINDSKLVFRNDHDFNTLLTKSKCKVVLVDHHVLARRDKFLAPFVTEIIDHRPIDKSGWTFNDVVRSTVETVGSCCTLVAQRIKDLGALVAKDVDFFNAYPLCTEMLRATIILDTVNFSTDVNKATPHDEEIMVFLEGLMKPGDHMADRYSTDLRSEAKLAMENLLPAKSKEKYMKLDLRSEAKFEIGNGKPASSEVKRKIHETRQTVHDCLVAARKNVTNLTPAQLLKKDVKIVGDVFIPSFPILVQEFLNRPGALQAVSEALLHNKCTIALLLGMDLTAGLQRDTAVYSPVAPEKALLFSKHLEDFTSPSLALSPEHPTGAKECNYYRQLNLSASRKQYIPAVNTFTNKK